MATIKRYRQLCLVFCLGLMLIMAVSVIYAQQQVGRIIITGSDTSSAPTVRLHLLAVDSDGNPVMLDPQSVVVLHNGQEISEVSSASPYEGGTFTVFLLDVPEGVAGSIPSIQEAIQQFASDPTMKERLDAVAIFLVDELAATQLLEPSEFYNSVRNAFASPLTPKSGATALIDSSVGLLNNLDTLKPRPDMVTHLVLISDGTDIVSTQFEAGDLPRRAAELGVSIHTVALENQSMSAAGREEGRAYLAQLASGTQGLATTLGTADDLRPIWEKIASFRNQSTIQYTATDIAGGDYSVEVSLRDNPAVASSTTVTFHPGAPSVVIELPPESRSMTLTSLDQPITLKFSTNVSWLDGVDRSIERAQLIVNGLAIQEIDAGSLDQFDAELGNLRFGDNQIQIAVVDDQGNRATSPEIILAIQQGEITEIPEEIAPSSLFDRIWQRVSGVAIGLGGCFLVLVILVLITGLTIAGRHSRLIQSLGLVNLLRRVPFLRGYFQDVAQIQGQVRRAKYADQKARRYSADVRGASSSGKKGASTSAYLEVIESATRLPVRIDLEEVEVRLGRSANQANIVFDQDGTVSRIHAIIAQEGGNYRIFDEQSTSGTWVNEQRVPDYGLQLVDGDEIRLGAVRLRFRQP